MSRAHARDWWEHIGEEIYWALVEAGESYHLQRAEEYMRHYLYLESLP